MQLLGTCAVPVWAAPHERKMATFLYRCPTTRLRVQGWVVDGPTWPGKQSYEAVNCPACGGVHLVNPTTGKTAADRDDDLNWNGRKNLRSHSDQPYRPGGSGRTDHTS